MHRTHHSDHDCDFSTAARFHPVEVVYTTAILSGTIAALGLPAVPVFVSQLLTTAISFAEHGNVRITASVERVLKLFIVTPDMHRIHHSAARSNRTRIMDIVPVGDSPRSGTYVDEPAAGDDGVIFGLGEFNEQQHQTLLARLAQPFARDAASEPRFGSRRPNLTNRLVDGTTAPNESSFDGTCVSLNGDSICRAGRSERAVA